jgi:hypothetical protein
MACHIMEPKGSTNLQMDRKYGPKYDKPILGSDEELLPELKDSGLLNSLLRPHENNVDENENCEPESLALLNDRSDYYYNRFQVANVSQMVAMEISQSHGEESGLDMAAATVAVVIDYDPLNYKMCPICTRKYSPRKIVCETGCNNKKNPLQKFVNGKLLVEEVAKKTDYGGQIAPYAIPLCASLKLVRCPNGSEISSAAIQSTVINSNIDVKQKYNSFRGTQTEIQIETLFPMSYNPSGHANIKAIYDILGCTGGVEGFVVDGPNLAPWREISMDLGAAWLDLLDENREKSKYSNLRFRFPSGHEGFCINHTVMKLLWEIGLDCLACCYGFTSPQQISFFMLGTLSHKTYDFICICREVLTDWMIAAWIKSIGNINDILEDPELRFQQWMHDEDAKSDLHFSNIVFLLDNIFPAYSIFTKGIRRCKQPVYNGGRKLLLPFLGKIGKYPYFKGIIRDIIELEYRVKDAYRIFRKEHFTFGIEDGACQSLDMIMEEKVAAHNATTVRKSEIGTKVAALCVESNPKMRETFLKQSGKPPIRVLNRVKLISIYHYKL